MLKRLTVLTLAALLAASLTFAEQARQFTGNDYLALANQKRLATVTALINDAKAGGVKIRQAPVSYCKRLDAFYAGHPDMRKEPLAVVLKTLIVMEYDWDQKGVDKDVLARQMLGDKTYQQNKTRLNR